MKLAETLSSSPGPVGDHPLINLSLCIGCGSCVDACPEHALGLIEGHSSLIYPGKCVGHSVCRDACPVEAITITREDHSTREDIPLLSPVQESSVPGLFIAGELAGQALIRVAIQDAIRAVEEISTRSPGKVLILGAGPGGMTAGLACQEKGIPYVILEQNEHFGGTINHYPRRKLVMTAPVSLPAGEKLTRLEYRKEKLLDLWKLWKEKHHLDIRFGFRVTSISTQPDGSFSVTSSEGETESGKYVILALGRRGSPRKLGVPGETLEKVAYTLIDAAAFKKSRILIVGGGDSAVEAAMALSFQDGNEVTVSYRQSSFSRIKSRNEERLAQLTAKGKIRVIFNSEVLSVEPDAVTVKTEQGTTRIQNDEVFIFIGGELPFQLLKSAGIRFGGGK
ncbi:MAG: NAD(P)-binding domain-containing protein [Bacteroidetes bacterium]|nr:NAD(P)-binding domain-containing protein [Bacteroidota bacterium]